MAVHVPPGGALRAVRGAARERARPGLSPACTRSTSSARSGRPTAATSRSRRSRRRSRATSSRTRSPSIVAAGAVPFAVGGDHSIALPAMRAVAKKHGPLAVVHVDAHLDTSDAEVWGDAYHHGTPAASRHRGGPRRARAAAPGRRSARRGATRRRARSRPAHGATLYDVDAIATRGIALRRAAHRRVRRRPPGLRDVRRRRRRPGLRARDRNARARRASSSREAHRPAARAGGRAAWSAWTSSRSARRSTTPTSRATSRPTCSSRGLRSPRVDRETQAFRASRGTMCRLRNEAGTLSLRRWAGFRSPWHEYPDAAGFDEAWVAPGARQAAHGRGSRGIRSRGAPFRSYELGAPDGAPVLLTGLMHGVEMVGLARAARLRAAPRRPTPRRELLRHARLVVVPVVNPDALHANCARLAAGPPRLPAVQRARASTSTATSRASVRDMPMQPARRLALARLAALRRAAAPLSEPETQALRDVAEALRPRVSVAFHSFGELLLYPWAFTVAPQPAAREVRARGPRLRPRRCAAPPTA